MAKHHEAVAWLRRAARSCWAACFLIELRCALWASPPSITAFVLPALLCQPVRAALVRPAQVLGSYIASASQVLVSALVRRYGLGSLAHRAGSAVACGSAWHRVCVAVVALARYGHPLRFYITPHFVKCAPVAALKLRLVPPTASRPLGFTKQALCKVAFAGVGRTAVGASRSLARPTRRRLRALVAVVAPGH